MLVDSILVAGFTQNDISVLLCLMARAQEILPMRKIPRRLEGTFERILLAAGGAVGGALGLLAGISALSIPGLGAFIAAGPIMGTLAGLGVGGAVGGLIGALVGMGMPEY